MTHRRQHGGAVLKSGTHRRSNHTVLSHPVIQRSAWSAYSLIALGMLALGLLGCKSENPNDYTVSHWLKDPDPCVRKTAAAIVASGRPWPNETLDDKHRLVRFDFWVGDQLYDLPASVPIRYNNFSPRAHPLKYSVVTGNGEEFLGVPREHQKTGAAGGVGATLSGNVYCRIDLPPSERIENAPYSSATRTEALRQYQRSLERLTDRIAGTVISDRQDIRMTEFRSQAKATDRQSGGYFPLDRDIEQTIDGRRVVKVIRCSKAYDPDAPLDVAALCHSWIYLGPGLWIEFQVYPQMLPIVPDLHDKLLAIFEQSRKK